ncbi:MAG: DUF4276 family protein [Planctomycetes bacterium]|nr:DUF4276 family protein [Planctomycetota bacterium]
MADQRRTIVPIVEGVGEVTALPKLLHALREPSVRRGVVGIAAPKNAHGRENIIKEGGLEKFLGYAQGTRGCCGIMVVIDANGDCPLTLARQLSSRAKKANLPAATAIVLAKRVYETWFLASWKTIAVGLGSSSGFDGDVEGAQGVKDWISQQMPVGQVYKETVDQARFSSLIDPELAASRSRSFRRLVAAFKWLLARSKARPGRGVVSPAPRTKLP